MLLIVQQGEVQTYHTSCAKVTRGQTLALRSKPLIEQTSKSIHQSDCSHDETCALDVCYSMQSCKVAWTTLASLQ